MFKFNNEEIGIAAEIAIADAFDVAVTENYRTRSNDEIYSTIVPRIRVIFENEGIPTPLIHIAEGQNPIDFLLAGNKTLSVKTNQKFSKKVAPQNVGQPTSTTYFSHFSNLYTDIPKDYIERCKLFKSTSVSKIDEVMAIYWNNLFHCDYLIHFFNLIDGNSNPIDNFDYVVYPYLDSKNFDKSKFTFTQSVNSWNESNTVKYHNITLGEFQVHNNRDCFKFRFNMDGVNELLEKGLL